MTGGRESEPRNPATAKPDLTRRWEPDQAAFARLLEWLDEGRDSHGERYLDIRDRLVRYFARRNCPSPDDLADETLNRVTRRLDESGPIEGDAPARYCYIAARFVLLESLRLRARQPGTGLRDEGAALAVTPGDAAAGRERVDARLERCLGECTPYDRELLLEYYAATSGIARERRKQLAERLGLSPHALAIRACRIRSRLEQCVKQCQEP